MRLRVPLLCTAIVLLAPPAWSETADSSVLYRCPGNDYSNTLSAAEAEKLHCKRVENAAVTVIRSADRAASGTATPVPAAAPVEAKMPAENAAMRSRASNARRDLESRLKTEERQLSALEVAFNGGEPERRKDEANLQKYLDRIANMRTEIARKQIDIAELRRELDKLPTSR
jgi:chromosome segregation ATPase